MDQVEVDLDENLGDLGYGDELDPEVFPERNKDTSGVDYEALENEFQSKDGFKQGPVRSRRKNFRNQRFYGNRGRGSGRYEQNRYTNNREWQGHGPYGRPNNRNYRNNFKPRNEEDEVKFVDAKLVTLLDSFSTAKEDLLSLFEDLKVLPDKYNKAVTSTFVKCVQTFPVKTGAYASLVGLLKVSGKTDLVDSINQQVLYNLGMKLSEGNRTECVLLLRFLIGLHCSNVTSNSVFDVLSSLLKLASEVENFNYDNNVDYAKSVVTLDNLYYIVLASIPWFSRDAFMNNVELVTSMCEKLFEYSERRMKLHESLNNDLNFNPNVDLTDTKKRFNPYCYKYYFKDTVSVGLNDRFSSGVEALRSLLKNDWTSSTTYRFYQSKGIVEKLNEPSEYQENKVTADNLNSILHLDIKNFNNFKPVNPKSFNFNYTLDRSQMTTVHDKWLFEEHVYYVFEQFSDDSLRCAQQLLGIPLNEEFKEYGIVDVLLNLALSKYYSNYYSVFGILVMHNLCTLEQKTEDIFYSYVGQLLVETDRLDSSVLNTLVNLSAFWFNMEFCKIRTSFDDINIEGENSDELKKELIRKKNSRLFNTLFKVNNCPNNYNLRLIEKISRLIYMDRLLFYSPKELENEIKALNLSKNFKDKPYEHQLFLNMFHFNRLSPEENDLRNRRIVTFINSYTNRQYLKEPPKHLFSQIKETKDYDEIIHEDEEYELVEQSNVEVGVVGIEGDKTVGNGMGDDGLTGTDSLRSGDRLGVDGVALDSTNMNNNNKDSYKTVKVWSRDELIMLFWDTLLIFGSKSLTHLYRLFEFHSGVLNMFETGEVPFEHSLPYKVMWQTVVTFDKDHKRLELSFDYFIRNNVFNCVTVLQFLLTLPNDKVLTNFFFYSLNSLFSEVLARINVFRESYKVASRDLAGTVAMEAKKQELDMAELDYFNLVSLFVNLVSNRMVTSDTNLVKVFEELVLNSLVKFGLTQKLILRLYQENPEVHDRVKLTLYRLAMPSYLSY